MKAKNYKAASLLKLKRYVVGIVVSLLLAAFGLQSLPPSHKGQPIQNQTDGEYVDVLRVIDGDTIEVSRSGVKESVRLLGIDTPELTDKRVVVACLARRAAEETKRLLTGKRIKFETDPSQGDRDKYNRLLRFVFLEDGTHVNKLLIEQGFAHEYTYNLPYKYQSEFQASETSAQEKELGLWSKTECQ